MAPEPNYEHLWMKLKAMLLDSESTFGLDEPARLAMRCQTLRIINMMNQLDGSCPSGDKLNQLLGRNR